MSYECTAGDICAKFNYALPNPRGQSLYLVQPNPGVLAFRMNYILDPRNVVAQDIRGRENDFKLDVNGFEYLTRPTDEAFLDKQSIETNYYAEVRQLVKEHTSADQVFIITHRTRALKIIRGHMKTLGKIEHHRSVNYILQSRDLLPWFQHTVHVDRTPESVAAEVKKYLGEDAERLVKGRVRFINVWRPIEHKVHHEPLGFADWQTSSESDLLPVHVDNVYAKFDVFLSRFNKTHNWYYLGHQTPSEIAMIKCYDSHPDGGANFCLHSSFIHPGCHRDNPRRRSIEVNTLVFG
ncbi:putative methyltransferase-like protein [Rhizoctonia solani 123E]|uniref:Putative methyltransferase-like protein n=1 Tax=Rhizoctonia solani 123E TaxID=1423351 RepID=A0A074RLB9_9AGAM|nr:putative methyltransferase-like protein [Rhizoctonia solani 123E]